MKRALLVALSSTVAFADGKKPPPRDVVAATGWITAMTDPSASEPMGYTKKRPLELAVQSDQPACAKFQKAKVTALGPVKACFVATWNHVAKQAELDIAPMRPNDLDGDQIKWKKTAPRGTTFVAAKRSYAGQDLEIAMAVAPDFTVIAAWLVYLEHDGE